VSPKNAGAGSGTGGIGDGSGVGSGLGGPGSASGMGLGRTSDPPVGIDSSDRSPPLRHSVSLHSWQQGDSRDGSEHSEYQNYDDQHPTAHQHNFAHQVRFHQVIRAHSSLLASRIPKRDNGRQIVRLLLQCLNATEPVIRDGVPVVLSD
jgi:hypothetical protein